ncbi:MAG: HPF/RaiA family ribosome-associated protein [Patescibacteria group bacterium]
MQIHFKGTNYELPPDVSELAKRKVEGLTKYLGKGKEHARAYVDLGKETLAHQNGRIWRADINFDVDVDGDRYYAKAIEESIEKAIDTSVAELGKELQTAQKRRQGLARKGGSIIKSLMRGGLSA